MYEKSDWAKLMKQSALKHPGIDEPETIEHRAAIKNQEGIGHFGFHIELHGMYAVNIKNRVSGSQTQKVWCFIDLNNDKIRDRLEKYLSNKLEMFPCWQQFHHRKFMPDILDLLNAEIPIYFAFTNDGDVIMTGPMLAHFGYTWGRGYENATAITFGNFTDSSQTKRILYELDMATRIWYKKKYANNDNIPVEQCPECNENVIPEFLVLFSIAKYDQEDHEVEENGKLRTIKKHTFRDGVRKIHERLKSKENAQRNVEIVKNNNTANHPSLKPLPHVNLLDHHQNSVCINIYA